MRIGGSECLLIVDLGGISFRFPLIICQYIPFAFRSVLLDVNSLMVDGGGEDGRAGKCFR